MICSYFHREIQENNLVTNIAETRSFILPSGQEIEKENSLIIEQSLHSSTLQVLQKR